MPGAVDDRARRRTVHAAANAQRARATDTRQQRSDLEPFDLIIATG